MYSMRRVRRNPRVGRRISCPRPSRPRALSVSGPVVVQADSAFYAEEVVAAAAPPPAPSAPTSSECPLAWPVAGADRSGIYPPTGTPRVTGSICSLPCTRHRPQPDLSVHPDNPGSIRNHSGKAGQTSGHRLPTIWWFARRSRANHPDLSPAMVWSSPPAPILTHQNSHNRWTHSPGSSQWRARTCVHR